MAYIIYILLLSLQSIILVRTTNSCNVIENMSCECQSSFNGEIVQLICNNFDKPIQASIRLTSDAIRTRPTFSSYHFTFYDKNLNVTSKFINELAYLFPKSPTLMGGRQQTTIKITLSFTNFKQLNFKNYSFSLLFGDKSYHTTMLTLELTSNGKVTFAPKAFSQLVVDQMFLHSASLEPYPFEEIFNNTNIGELTTDGLTPRSNDAYKANFNGRIRLGKFTKIVDTVSSEEFPNYPVRSMIIEAHEARKINGSSFMNYRNLHGLHLIRPKFFFDQRSFDGFQYVPSLETIELDAETFKDHTFQYASRIRFLTFGSNLRYLSEHSLDHLDDLIRFDLSKVVLDQLYPLSKCVLANFIAKQQKTNPNMIILPPQAEYCDCIYDYILTTLNRKPEQSYVDLCSDNQQERCQLTQCNIINNFSSSLKENFNYQPINNENQIEAQKPIHQIDNQQTTIIHQYLPYVHRHPSIHQQETKTNSDDSHLSALKANKPIDPNVIITDDYDENYYRTSSIYNSETATKISNGDRQRASKTETLKWISISLVCITILSLVLLGLLIWYCFFRSSKRFDKAGFQPIQPNSSLV